MTKQAEYAQLDDAVSLILRVRERHAFTSDLLLRARNVVPEVTEHKLRKSLDRLVAAGKIENVSWQRKARWSWITPDRQEELDKRSEQDERRSNLLERLKKFDIKDCGRARRDTVSLSLDDVEFLVSKIYQLG